MKPVLQRAVSVFQPQLKLTPLATTVPSQSTEHRWIRHGSDVGDTVGADGVGCPVGCAVGIEVGSGVGLVVGIGDGLVVGAEPVGIDDGERVGEELAGMLVGIDVGGALGVME